MRVIGKVVSFSLSVLWEEKVELYLCQSTFQKMKK